MAVHIWRHLLEAPMRPLRRVILILLGTVLAAAPSAAVVRVSFPDSARFTDGELRDADVRGSLRAHLQRLGGRLARGFDLNVTVLDIDLAGFDMSTRGPNNYRVLNGATWPKVKLRYVLTRRGKTVASGEEWVTDQFYRAHPGMASANDPLRYEKNMLDEWFQTRFSRRLRTAR
jgi:hypothetical protein